VRRLEFEVQEAAQILVKDMLGVKPGETVVITADTCADPHVVEAAAAAVCAAGGKPMAVWTATPSGVGKAADPVLPVEALSAVLSAADVWIEFNEAWLLYSTPFEKAMSANRRLRYICLVGMTGDMLVRTVGRVPREALEALLKKIAEMTRKASEMRVTTPAGTDLRFENDPARPVSCDTGRANIPGVHMLAGQVGWSPRFESIEGTLVFDGSISPPLGLLKEPMVLTIREGRIVNVEGGSQAEEYRAWLESFRDDNMFRLAHVCYGLNPGARLTGNILEDERVFGSTEWGIGYLSPQDAPPDGIPAPSHSDGICLSSSVWADGEQLLDKGKIVHPALAGLARLLKP